MGYSDAMKAHLAGGATTLARCFAVTRKDGLVLGFTDHDRDLGFDGITFRADSGLTAKAIQQATGLSVDNSEAFGALRSAAITEADILAGRYDGAEVRAWLVNWADPAVRVLQFRGTLGEIVRSGGAFTAELRGLSEALNQPVGLIYHARCSAVLGDGRCGFDLSQPGYAEERAVEAIEEGRVFRFAAMPGFEDRWFEKGRLVVLDGVAKGLVGSIKNDRVRGAGREVELWQGLGAVPAEGDMVRIEAGCDRRAETCRLKFNNFPNFRGFPHVPGEDWVMSYPVSSARNDGGSLSG
ncbi:putative phage protein (TIGR02218 family) [Defluviimonas denitrificans]|jgi:uncharacterized phage protein (TIGR02218 family)|uniref:Putative phage protein (TIGR02218 family) n=1 Tax=Albidovulum denitrificans TaxID=404881 RepID=A0A2S8SAJ8_9RHOB|nr:DUF2163 domain-containing protein [Defluviimonas denitrificans]PQV57822.1 putative phage protein (TIGR02218 family) [Defluviimonas denitrificans]